jgi:uncharacterized SAM-binding protein YcdF (DUF218 family)
VNWRWLEAPLVDRRRARVASSRDAIVVLGAPVRADGRASRALAERIAAAAALWHAGGARTIVATGGVTRRAPRSEADAIADGLRAAGVPADAIVVEARALSTIENARFTAELLGSCAVWLVTQPFHGRRAARAFRAAGLDARVWHVDGPPRPRAIAREYAAWARELIRSLVRPVARAVARRRS